jgi:GH24 family phage-related lysozyme (muramidase)
MQTSDKGIALIKQFEGCKLTAYQDSVGVGRSAMAGLSLSTETDPRRDDD